MRSKLFTSTLIITSIIIVNLYQCKKSENILPLTKSWEKAIQHQEIPEGLTSISAKSCGVCHLKHYNEWKLSTHAHAWTDLQFQSELKKESSPFMCINCHIPLQNQQEYIVSGLIDGDIYKPVKTINPHFDQDLQLEGITCASCHVRNKAIIGPTGSTTVSYTHLDVYKRQVLEQCMYHPCHHREDLVQWCQ